MMRFMERIRNDEQGNASLITILMLMPVIIAFFGLGIDAAKGNYARQSVDGNLQTALVAGVSQLQTNTNRIDNTAARALTIEQYTNNRENYGKALRCATASDLQAGESLQGGACKWILSSWSISSDRQTISMEVREFAPNPWLRTVGIDEFALKVGASASISYN